MAFATILASNDNSYFFRLCELVEKFTDRSDDMKAKVSKVLEGLPLSDADALVEISKKLGIHAFAVDKEARARKPRQSNKHNKYRPAFGKPAEHRQVAHRTSILVEHRTSILATTLSHVKGTIYLDVGCGVALKTIESARAMNIADGNIYGIDLDNGWLGYAKPPSCILHPDSGGDSEAGVKLAYYNPDGTFPFDRGQFDVISCYMVLHHLREEERVVMMGEIARCLSPGGHFVLREHNMSTPEECALADIEHLIYEVVKTGTPYEKYMKDYYGEYHPAQYWIDFCQGYGLKLVDTVFEGTITAGTIMVFSA